MQLFSLMSTLHPLQLLLLGGGGGGGGGGEQDDHYEDVNINEISVFVSLSYLSVYLSIYLRMTEIIKFLCK